jgi:hypothetical protein
MSADPTDALPRDLREAILAEIDPGETLRWCDRPRASRVFRSAILPALVLFLLLGAFGGGFIALGLSTWHELRESGMPRTAQGDGMGTVFGTMVVGSLIVAGSLLTLTIPWFSRQKALRTVYAVTDTRVLRLIRSRSGSVQLTAVEPGHPLSISRMEHRDGSGDIALYPSPANRKHAQLTLAATPRPREVERLIRTTFDPPR